MELQNVTHITSQSRIRKLGENEEMIISYAEQRTVSPTTTYVLAKST